MMADRVEVQFGGDTTELDAAAARADAALKKLDDTVRAQTGQTRTLDSVTQGIINTYVNGAGALQKGQFAFQGISEAVAAGTLSTGLGAKAYAGFAAELEKTTEKTTNLGLSVSQSINGVRALGDELASGRYRQATGTFGRLFFTFAEANPILTASLGAILAVGGGIAYLVYEAIEGQKRLEAFQGTMALLGRSGDASEARFGELMAAVQKYHIATSEEASKVVQSLASISTLTEAQKTKIAEMTGLYIAQGGSVDALIKALASGPSAMAKFAESTLNITAAQREQFTVAKDGNDTIKATDTLLDALNGRLAVGKKAWDDWAAQVSAAMARAHGLRGGMSAANFPPRPKVQMDTSGPSAEDEQKAAHLTDLTERYTAHARAISEARQAVADLTTASKAANITDEERAKRLEAVKEAQNELDALTAKKSTSEKESAAAAKTAAAERLATLQAEVAETQAGSEARVEAARKEVAEVGRLYGTSSKEYIAAQHALTMATKEEAQERAKAQVELDQAHREAALGEIAIKQEMLSEKKSMGEISDSEELDALAKLEDQKYQIELAGLRQRLALENLTLVEQAKINTQIEQLEQKHQLNMTKIADKAVQDQKARWQSYLQPINSAISTSIQGMIMQTTTLRGAVANLGQAVIAEFVGMAVKSATEWIATHLAMKAISKTTGLGEISTNAGVAASGAYAATALIPYVGPALAPAAAATAYAGAMSYGAMASAAGGWGQIPSDQIAQVHKDEMILPADIAGPVRDMAARGSGSGGDIHLHVSAIDAQSFAEALSQHDGAIHKAIKRANRNFQGSRFARP